MRGGVLLHDADTINHHIWLSIGQATRDTVKVRNLDLLQRVRTIVDTRTGLNRGQIAEGKISFESLGQSLPEFVAQHARASEYQRSHRLPIWPTFRNTQPRAF